MPREGLSETGQIIAAIATAIILALLAKYGLLPDEDGGKKEDDVTVDPTPPGGPTTIINNNIVIGRENFQNVARLGKQATTPYKGTPPTPEQESFDDSDIGILPIRNRNKDIMPNFRRANAMYYRLVVVLDAHYGENVRIGVYGYDSGDDQWFPFLMDYAGQFQSQAHFIAYTPKETSDLTKLVVLTRTDDALKRPDVKQALNFVSMARFDDSNREYVLTTDWPLNLFDDTTGIRAKITTFLGHKVPNHVPAIYIRKVRTFLDDGK